VDGSALSITKKEATSSLRAGYVGAPAAICSFPSLTKRKDDIS
jgi:hypothetical protein